MMRVGGVGQGKVDDVSSVSFRGSRYGLLWDEIGYLKMLLVVVLKACYG